MIPLKKDENVNPTNKRHPVTWHFDKPIVPDGKTRSALVKRLSSTGYLKKSQPHQRSAERRTDTEANSNQLTEKNSKNQVKYSSRKNLIKTKSMNVLTPYGLKNIVAADSTIKINQLKFNKNLAVFGKPTPEKSSASKRI